VEALTKEFLLNIALSDSDLVKFGDDPVGTTEQLARKVVADMAATRSRRTAKDI
jgi:hypothetical protein